MPRVFDSNLSARYKPESRSNLQAQGKDATFSDRSNRSNRSDRSNPPNPPNPQAQGT